MPVWLRCHTLFQAEHRLPKKVRSSLLFLKSPPDTMFADILLSCNHFNPLKQFEHYTAVVLRRQA